MKKLELNNEFLGYYVIKIVEKKSTTLVFFLKSFAKQNRMMQITHFLDFLFQKNENVENFTKA
jgi:hypothetical protein